MWCKACNIETNDTACPICGAETVEDTPTEIYWCDHCITPVIQLEKQADKGICPICGNRIKYMAKDLRPVFPEERLLLEILLKKNPHDFMEHSVWAADSRYYINGKAISLSSKLFQDADADVIAQQLESYKSNNTYTHFNRHIQTFISANTTRLHYLKDAALLLSASEQQGFLTFDDILDAASTFLLSASEIDKLSDNLQAQGVLIYESAPEQISDDIDIFSDYSRTDYDAIFSEVTALSESLSPLIDIVRDVPPPQFGEIQTLVEQLQYENAYARDRLVLSHLRIAVKIALSIAKQYSYDIEDAVSASLIGLMEAVEHFDPNGFSAFQSYASMWIQQNIHRYCNPIWMQFYFPVHIKEKMYPVLLKYNRNNGTIIYDQQYDPVAVHAIAEELDFSPELVERYLRFAYNQMNCHFELDTLINYETNEQYLADDAFTLSIKNVTSHDKSPYKQACECVLKDTILELLGTLTAIICNVFILFPCS